MRTKKISPGYASKITPTLSHGAFFCYASGMTRWKALADAKPPIDRYRRCDDLWLYNARGVDVVVRGCYYDFGDAPDAEPGDLTPTHWALPLPDEKYPPSPPRL